MLIQLVVLLTNILASNKKFNKRKKTSVVNRNISACCNEVENASVSGTFEKIKSGKTNISSKEIKNDLEKGDQDGKKVSSVADKQEYQEVYKFKRKLLDRFINMDLDTNENKKVAAAIKETVIENDLIDKTKTDTLHGPREDNLNTKISNKTNDITIIKRIDYLDIGNSANEKLIFSSDLVEKVQESVAADNPKTRISEAQKTQVDFSFETEADKANFGLEGKNTSSDLPKNNKPNENSSNNTLDFENDETKSSRPKIHIYKTLKGSSSKPLLIKISKVNFKRSACTNPKTGKKQLFIKLPVINLDKLKFNPEIVQQYKSYIVKGKPCEDEDPLSFLKCNETIESSDSDISDQGNPLNPLDTQTKSNEDLQLEDLLVNISRSFQNIKNDGPVAGETSERLKKIKMIFFNMLQSLQQYEVESQNLPNTKEGNGTNDKNLESLFFNISLNTIELFKVLEVGSNKLLNKLPEINDSWLSEFIKDFLEKSTVTQFISVIKMNCNRLFPNNSKFSTTEIKYYILKNLMEIKSLLTSFPEIFYIFTCTRFMGMFFENSCLALLHFEIFKRLQNDYLGFNDLPPHQVQQRMSNVFYKNTVIKIVFYARGIIRTLYNEKVGPLQLFLKKEYYEVFHNQFKRQLENDVFLSTYNFLNAEMEPFLTRYLEIFVRKGRSFSDPEFVSQGSTISEQPKPSDLKEQGTGNTGNTSNIQNRAQNYESHNFDETNIDNGNSTGLYYERKYLLLVIYYLHYNFLCLNKEFYKSGELLLIYKTFYLMFKHSNQVRISDLVKKTLDLGRMLKE